MAKKKISTTTETNDQEKLNEEAQPKATRRKKSEAAAEGEAKKPATRRRKKADEEPLAEMGAPVTGAGEENPKTRRGRPRKADQLEKDMKVPVAETDEVQKQATKRRGKSAKKQEELQVPVAEKGGVREVTKLTKRGSRGKAVLASEAAQHLAQAQQEDMPVWYASRFTEFDIYLFREGRHFALYDKLGSHPMSQNGRQGVYFAVWAPNAEQVSVMGEFNGWSRDNHQLHVRHDGSGIWEGFVPDVNPGTMYKYHIKSKYHLYHVEKSDPFAFCREVPPQTASIVCDLSHDWNDQEWMQRRDEKKDQPQPYSVYEIHLGSWRRKLEDNNRPLTYRELAEVLPAYVQEMGFTHVEFMPVMHHPFSGSWGYQVTGYFAAYSMLGSPQDLMYLIDELHRHDIGVILDWVPSHFPSDEHGLAYFDGTHLFEHADPRKGFHPDWNSYIFNYGRNEVRSFLISSALFWLDKYHIDGLRVDAVASMLYLDYSRKEGEWIPNEHGGRENLEAISFLKDFNEAVQKQFPSVKTIAEESTAWPGVTQPLQNGGLGFDMKWMMGWMHDTLHYFSKDPVYRRHHQGEITFSLVYAFSERFMLPLSHDEVVHGKGSLLRKMPGDEWQQFANLRALYSYMYAHPGAKLLFMGADVAQSSEWNHDSSLDWHLLQYGYHKGIQEILRELNAIYKAEPAMYENSFSPEGFEWVDLNDAHNSVISFLRKGKAAGDELLVVCNLTPVVHEHYRLGVPHAGQWIQVFNSDDRRYGGSDVHNPEPLNTMQEPFHGREYSLTLKLPPLAVLYFKLNR